MSARWQAWATADPEPPVEMRFIDLFMAAIGALIFMAMLMSFLIRYVPKEPEAAAARLPPIGRLPPLTIATASLPNARVGQPYEIAFAYRSGAGIVRWKVVAGGDELPVGLAFDADSGTLAGTPGRAGVARFVLQARDAMSDVAQRPFELRVDAASRGAKGVETWVAMAMLVMLTFVWFATVSGVSQTKRRLAVLVNAAERGQGQVIFSDAGSEAHVIRLPEGVADYQARLKAARRISAFIALLVIALAVWLVWSIWFAPPR